MDQVSILFQTSSLFIVSVSMLDSFFPTSTIGSCTIEPERCRIEIFKIRMFSF